MKSWVNDARTKSGLSPEQCAAAIRRSKNTYMSREDNPESLTISELRDLNSVFGDEGRRILWGALQDLKA